MAYTITGPQKLIHIKSFLSSKTATPKVCLDIGGNKESFEFFYKFFPKTSIHTLNNYNGHLKGVPTPVKFDAENCRMQTIQWT